MTLILILASVIGFSETDDSRFVLDPTAAPLSIAAAAEEDFSVQPSSVLNVRAVQEEAPAPARFGADGSTYWFLNAGGGSNFEHDGFARAGVGLSYFLADDISIDLELNFMYFDQEVENAFGVNPNLLFRWHFLHDDARTWSVYADGGAGILISTEDVPAHGSSFNFTPQIGVGVSFEAWDDARLFIGARWHHVSNARLYEENPGRDYGMLYAMLAWPF